ncbi:hypothetical protein DFA_12147 [Cavenderia fasciculata]|uniref:Uncharacterized protein n=1 Tax=Cavenderia fasciculata TaxID=261658 RepID=F4QC94_CACFS|nr:uncharacterized protein DFA_12147 [Cavenderia fasciculata]EGG14375.1 hypothetical protein DFA_12147 [Cavenderia fasciculata]|eukprot:XP_004353784.1 hypothetical protein DFA_12147 [Cavenderia fasciculata]
MNSKRKDSEVSGSTRTVGAESPWDSPTFEGVALFTSTFADNKKGYPHYDQPQQPLL